MKKTFNINVAGFPFTIDDDAYTLLSDYLDTIEHAFAKQDDSRELVNDIESRIAELLLEQTSSGSAIVTAQDVEQVIRRVGQPEEMIEEDETISIDSEKMEYKETVTPPPLHSSIAETEEKIIPRPAECNARWSMCRIGILSQCRSNGGEAAHCASHCVISGNNGNSISYPVDSSA